MFVTAIGKLSRSHRVAFTITGVCGPLRRIGYFSSLRSGPLYLGQRASLVTRFQSSSQTKKLPFEVETRVSQDVLLFKYENRRYFSILSFFAISQFIFWSYLAHFSYTTLRDVRQNDDKKKKIGTNENPNKSKSEEQSKLAWWRRINLGENKYRIGITVLCASIGYIILAGASMYTLRTVRTLTLVKGGLKVRIVSYTPWFRDRVIEVPLNDLSCELSREYVKSNLPIKIRGYFMFFLLDKSGTYMNTKLFDYTAGVKRLWSKQK